MIKNVIFDFDGTVVDSSKLVLKLSNDMAREWNMEPPDIEDLKELSGLTIKQRCKKLNIPLYRLPIMNLAVQDKVKSHIDDLEWIDGMEQVLKTLKQAGINLKMISSNTVQNINRFFENNNADYFSSIYSSRGIFDKHLSIRALLKKYKLKRQETIYVGDEFRDIRASKKAKVDIISVTWGFDSAELLQKGKPEYMVTKPEQILGIVLAEGRNNAD